MILIKSAVMFRSLYRLRDHWGTILKATSVDRVSSRTKVHKWISYLQLESAYTTMNWKCRECRTHVKRLVQELEFALLPYRQTTEVTTPFIVYILAGPRDKFDWEEHALTCWRRNRRPALYQFVPRWSLAKVDQNRSRQMTD